MRLWILEILELHLEDMGRKVIIMRQKKKKEINNFFVFQSGVFRRCN